MYFDDKKRLSTYRDMPFYQGILQRFLDTGIAEMHDNGDALNVYLCQVMSDPMIRIQALGSEVGKAIFLNVMLRLVFDVVDKMKFKAQMAQGDLKKMGEAAEWSERKKNDGWQGLVDTLGAKYGEFGFDKNFYMRTFSQKGRLAEDKTTWEKMIHDWLDAMSRKQQKDIEWTIRQKDKNTKEKLQRYSADIPQYLEKKKIDKDEFLQGWGMMNGSWDTTQFERLLSIVRLQRQYPQIVRITNKMGRIANDDGDCWMSLTQGNTQKIEHSSRSDIEGVTVGNDLEAMMPTEMAYASDDDLEDMFLKRYIGRELQMFRYKSEIMKPTKHFNKTRMIRRGPMIVCVDTSKSMIGRPETIAHSVLLRIMAIAHEQRRQCFLIGFSVLINPIDVGANPNALLNFFGHSNTGNTDAVRMMEKTFSLLDSNRRYMNADVIWITDFRIPLPNDSLLHKHQSCRTAGTCFYGLQIGISALVKDWHPYFDEIEQISYTPSRTY